MARKRAEEEAAAEEAKKSKAKPNAPKPKKENSSFAVKFGEDWKEAFAANKSLIHVDLSNNKIDLDDCEIIAEGLKINHSILGIHFRGNAGYVDNQGFVVAAEDGTKSDNVLLTRLPDDLQSGKIRNPTAVQLQQHSNCWLCEGWTQVKFRYLPGISDDNPEHDPFKPIKLHLEIDQY